MPDLFRKGVPRANMAFGLTLAIALALMLATPSLLFAGTYEATWRASVATDGGQPFDYDAEYPAVSDSGRYVVFECEAANLATGDTNGVIDVFKFDRQTGETARVSMAAGGAQGSGPSTRPDISADGRFVAFTSYSQLLTDGAAGTYRQIYVVDQLDGTVSLASKSSGGATGDNNQTTPSLSADGRYVAFSSSSTNLVMFDSNGYDDVFVHDRQDGTTVRVSVANDGQQATDNYSSDPAISADGRTVAFESRSQQLAPDTTAFGDIFAHDLDSHATEKISLSTGGAHANQVCEHPSITADGRYVVFDSFANNLIDGDSNNATDVFLRDRQLDTTTRVSLSDTDAQLTGPSRGARISDDGRYVAFISESAGVVAGVTGGLGVPTRVYVRDLVNGTTSLVSSAFDGTPNDDDTDDLDIGASGNSSFVVFASDSTNLVPDVQNGYYYEIFEHEMTDLPGDEGSNDVAGTTRYATGVEISKATFPSGSDTVVIATGRDWPDALGGAALAGAWDAPILLVDTTSVPTVVASEIERLGATRAIILGGTAVVTDAVRTQLLATGSIDAVERIGGANRFLTAQMVADAAITKAGPDFDGTAFVATGANFPDALAGSPISYANKWPIYLVKPGSTPPTTVMDADGIKSVLILGGTAVVSDTAETTFETAFGASNVDRLSGDNRYATAVAVATYGVDDAGLHWDGLGFATGQNFPDALAGGSITGRHDSVMLLVESAELPAPVETALTAHTDRITTWSYLGGLSAIDEGVRTQIDSILE